MIVGLHVVREDCASAAQPRILQRRQAALSDTERGEGQVTAPRVGATQPSPGETCRHPRSDRDAALAAQYDVHEVYRHGAVLLHSGQGTSLAVYPDV